MDLYNKDMIAENMCSFCGRNTNEYDLKLIRGFNSNICNDCIEKAYNAVKQSERSKKHLFKEDLPKPIEIKDFLDKYIIGQEDAKKVLSVAVYNHYKRIAFGNLLKNDSKFKDLELEKSNILLLGPTGSGKTLFARTLAKKLNVPFAIADATTLTEAGYVGDDVENILLKLIQAADYDISLAETGIIYIDEIDKIAKKGENVSITRDVSGEGVQQALLKIIEGTDATVPPQGGRKHPSQELLHINTNNILFICGGAFVGLEKIVQSRVNKKSMGFGAEIKKGTTTNMVDLYKNLHPEDLVKFGLIPEFVGRMPIASVLNYLTEDDLVKILKEPKNSILKQFEWSLALEDVELEFKENAIRSVAKQANEQKTGARGLRSIIEKIMLDVMYNIPSDSMIKKVLITKEVIENNKPVRLIKKGSEKTA